MDELARLNVKLICRWPDDASSKGSSGSGKGSSGKAAIRSGFRHIEEVTQNRWNYLNYLFYLFKKDPTEYSGPESYINEMVANKDIGWLPIGKSRLTDEGQL